MDGLARSVAMLLPRKRGNAPKRFWWLWWHAGACTDDHPRACGLRLVASQLAFGGAVRVSRVLRWWRAGLGAVRL
jgi:hypothetical protein